MGKEPLSTSRFRLLPRNGFAKTLALLLALGTGTVAALFHLRFRVTPSFDDYLRTQPMLVAELAALQPTGQLLAAADHWAIGADDPFTFVTDDARPRQRTNFVLDIKRDAEVLLHLEQEFAVVMQAADGARTGAALRTVQCKTMDGMRAEVRIYVHDIDLLLAPGGGAVTFDVMLGAGEGPDRVAVAAIPISDLTATEPVPSQPRTHGLFDRLWPFVSLPSEGLVHRVRTRATQSFMRVPDGFKAAVVTDIVHAVNTSEYSYDVQSAITIIGETGKVSRTLSRRQSFSWNKQLW